MNIEQAFVGGVAILLGLLAIFAAALNSDSCFRLPKARWAEQRWGRGGARWAFLLIGLVLILLGLYIALLEPPRRVHRRLQVGSAYGSVRPGLATTRTGGSTGSAGRSEPRQNRLFL